MTFHFIINDSGLDLTKEIAFTQLLRFIGGSTYYFYNIKGDVGFNAENYMNIIKDDLKKLSLIYTSCDIKVHVINFKNGINNQSINSVSELETFVYLLEDKKPISEIEIDARNVNTYYYCQSKSGSTFIKEDLVKLLFILSNHLELGNLNNYVTHQPNSRMYIDIIDVSDVKLKDVFNKYHLIIQTEKKSEFNAILERVCIHENGTEFWGLAENSQFEANIRSGKYKISPKDRLKDLFADKSISGDIQISNYFNNVKSLFDGFKQFYHDNPPIEEKYPEVSTKDFLENNDRRHNTDIQFILEEIDKLEEAKKNLADINLSDLKIDFKDRWSHFIAKSINGRIRFEELFDKRPYKIERTVFFIFLGFILVSICPFFLSLSFTSMFLNCIPVILILIVSYMVHSIFFHRSQRKRLNNSYDQLQVENLFKQISNSELRQILNQFNKRSLIESKLSTLQKSLLRINKVYNEKEGAMDIINMILNMNLYKGHDPEDISVTNYPSINVDSNFDSSPLLKNIVLFNS